MKKDGVANPYQYDPCIDCGKPARRYEGSKGRCRDCNDIHRAAQHGTESRYMKGCRCPRCMRASAAARRHRRHAAKTP